MVLNYEFKANINRYFESLGPGAPVKNLAELIAFNEQHRDREMPFFGTSGWSARRGRLRSTPRSTQGGRDDSAAHARRGN